MLVVIRFIVVVRTARGITTTTMPIYGPGYRGGGPFIHVPNTIRIERIYYTLPVETHSRFYIDPIYKYKNVIEGHLSYISVCNKSYIIRHWQQRRWRNVSFFPAESPLKKMAYYIFMGARSLSMFYSRLNKYVDVSRPE